MEPDDLKIVVCHCQEPHFLKNATTLELSFVIRVNYCIFLSDLISRFDEKY